MRVVMEMDPQGLFSVTSDAPIDFFVVCDHVPDDRVYQMDIDVGPEKVRKILGDDAIGHAEDSFIETRTGYGKKPPAKASLSVVPSYENVEPLNVPSPIDRDPMTVIGLSRERFSRGVVMIGYDADGDFVFDSSFADGGDVLWLLEVAKKKLLEAGG